MSDPIVISGMAVEAPGGIDSPSALWSALAESRELVGSFPRDRGWPLDDLLSVSRLDGWGRSGFLVDSGLLGNDWLFLGSRLQVHWRRLWDGGSSI